MGQIVVRKSWAYKREFIAPISACLLDQAAVDVESSAPSSNTDCHFDNNSVNGIYQGGGRWTWSVANTFFQNELEVKWMGTRFVAKLFQLEDDNRRRLLYAADPANITCNKITGKLEGSINPVNTTLSGVFCSAFTVTIVWF